MRNLFEENSKLAIGLTICVVIVGYGVSDFLKSRQEKTLNQIEQIEGGRTSAGHETARRGASD